MKRFGTLCAAAAVLLVLIGCEFKVDKYPAPNPFNRIIFSDEYGFELADDFYYFAPRERSAVISARGALEDGTGVNASIKWEVASGQDNLALSGSSGGSVTIRAAVPGNATVKVTAAHAGVTIERNLAVLIGSEDSANWMFRILENTGGGLAEIDDGGEIIVVFNDDKIIELEKAGTYEDVIFTMQSSDPLIKIASIGPGVFAISGNEKVTAPVTVRARTENQFFSKEFTVRMMGAIPLAPLVWDSSTDPIREPLSAGAGGRAHRIAGTDYYFRAATSTLAVTPEGAFRFNMGPSNGPKLIVGGGNSVTLPNPAGTPTSVAGTLAPGQFDLTSGNTFRFTVYFKDLEEAPDLVHASFRIMLNNNTTSWGLSPIAGNSPVNTELNGGSFNNTHKAAGRVVMDVNALTKFPGLFDGTGFVSPAQDVLALASLEEAFFCIYSLGQVAVTIYRIELEELWN